MYTFKRITALFLAVSILLLTIPTAYASASDVDMRYGKEQLGKMPNSAALQFVYDKLVSGCAGSVAETISISDSTHKITIDELYTVYSMFYSDYPEYFWIENGGYSYSHFSDGIVVAIRPTYIDSIDNINDAKTEYNQKIAELTYGLEGKSDYDKSLILHDRLCETTEYISNDNDQNAYGALVQGEAVCNGYARAYQHLMQTVGISCWYVRGYSSRPGTSTMEAHAWNVVKLDGVWYYTDVTWDDQGEDTFYAFFNITEKQLKEDHIIETETAKLVPSATATDANYFIKNDLMFSQFDQYKLTTVLNNKDNKAQIYVSGNVEDFKSQIKSNASAIATALGATGGYSYGITYLGNALIIDFNITVSCAHKYTNACDADCNLCGATRTPAAHKYDDSKDSTCNVCGTVRDVSGTPISWSVSVAKTGIYNITPSKTLNGFTKDSITVLDKNETIVKYNDSNKGWPLVMNQEYSIRLNSQFSNTTNLNWKVSQISASAFPDTAANQWYSDAVAYAVGRGLIGGYGNGNFGPADNIQRQDFLVILARLDGVDLTSYGKQNSSFPDVPEGSYYEAAVNWGAKYGIVTGYQNGKFGTGDKITREQLVTFLYRYANYKGLDTGYTTAEKNKVKNTYTDYKNVTSYAQDPVIWAVTNGVISGKTSTTIVPSGNALRCEVAQIMYNIYQNDLF